jgi:hypothetical protein
MLKFINSLAVVVCSASFGADLIVGAYGMAFFILVLALINLKFLFDTLENN